MMNTARMVRLLLTTSAGAMAAGAIAAGAMAGMTPDAHADATDDAFLAALTAKDIHFSSPQKAFIAGHEVCDELGNGKSPAQVASTVAGNSSLDGYHAGFFVGASIRAFCPQYAS